jgi:hypothetical protein
MSPIGRKLVAIFVTLGLAGCGKRLGVYQVDSVSVIGPADYANEPGLVHLGSPDAYPWLLKLQLSSQTDLQMVLGNKGGVYGVYLLFGKCPLESVDVPQALDFREVARPIDGSPHRFGYEAILIPSNPTSGVQYAPTNVPEPRYDLTTGNEDLCLRLFHPDYDLIRSRSRTFTLRRPVLKKALSESNLAS